MSLNACSFVGYAGRDAELRYFETGSQVANFNIAVNRRKSQKEPDPQPLWIKVEVWGKDAEVAGNYVRKGTMVAVTGEIDLEQWTSRKTGEQQASIKLNCRVLRLLSSNRDQDQGQGQGQGKNQGQPTRTGATARKAEATTWNSGGADDDDDIPF